MIVDERARQDSNLRLPPLRGFRPDIQVWRGLAVLLVVAYHARIVVHGGFVGVDVFFVISGFVIGRRLVADLVDAPAASARGLGAFYVHRARRILPALAAMLVIVILTAPFLAPVGGVPRTSPTGVAAALFSANAYLSRATGLGYFAAAAETNPLLHTWSLSVEEQFYFVIPALFVLAWWLGRRRRPTGPAPTSVASLRLLVGGILVGSFALCVRLTDATGTVLHVDGRRFAFFSPFTRAWEFAAGLALVLLPTRALAGPRLRPVLLALGLALVGYAAFAFSDSTVFPGAAALVPVAGAALLIHAGTRADTDDPAPLPRTLGPVAWIGDVSYSWYLWHWPFIVFAAGFWPNAGSRPLVIAAALSLLPAVASHRWLEQRLRAGPDSRARPTAVLAACCIVAPLVAAVVAIPIRTFAEHRTADRAAEFRSQPLQPGSRPPCNDSTPLDRRPLDLCTWGRADAPTTIALVGDSNAGHLSTALIGAADRVDARVRVATLSDCPFVDAPYVLPSGFSGSMITPDACHDFVVGTVAALEADPPDVVVVATSTDEWSSSGYVDMTDASGTRLPADRQAAAFEDGLTRVLDRLRAAGSRVVLVDIVPKPYVWDPRECSNLALTVDPQRCLPRSFAADAHPQRAQGTAIQHRAADRAGAVTWDLGSVICPDDRCRSVRNGHLVWSDRTHLSVWTSRRLVPTVVARLQDRR